MKKFTGILVILAALALAGGIFFYMRPADHSSHVKAVKEIYYCPMHPNYTSDRPGVCPICNMNLVKRDVTPGMSEEDQVKKHLSQICVMHNCHKAHGGTPCPMMAVVKKGEKVNCPICGEHVAGFPDNAQMSDGRGTVKISPEQRQLIGVTTAAVKTKELFRTVRAYGKVSRAENWIFAYIYEYERPFLYARERPLLGIQHRVELDFPALPGEVFTGRARLIDQEIDPETKTTRVRVHLDEGWRRLKPDMSANVHIKISLGASLAVPAEAVMDTGTRKVVFVDKGDGIIEPRQVVLGEKADRDYEVRSGLQEGERVVTSGNFLIDSESRLKAVFENAGASGGHDHGQ